MDNIKKISSKILTFLNRDIGWIEWGAYAIVSIFMFLVFQHGDIVGTAESSFLLLDGNILNFYDAVAEFSNGFISANYLLPTYILFALWNIPLKLIGMQPIIWGESGIYRIMWYKLLPTLFFLFSAYIFYKILLEVGFNKRNSKIGLFLYMSMPIAMFSQYMFGQYDSFTVFFMMLGLYYYFKGIKSDSAVDWWKFVLFMAIGMLFKTFLFAFFLPLLLLKEKRIGRLITSLGAFISPYIIFKFLFRGSVTFDEGINNFNAADFVKRVAISNGTESIQILPILFAVFCAYIFFSSVKNTDDFTKWVSYIGCMISVILFGIMHWHPQWLIISVMFLTLGLLLSKNFEAFLLLDIIGTFFYMAYILNADWADRINTWLATGGILGEKVLQHTPEIFPGDFFPIDSPSQAFSYLAAILFVYGIFHHPKYCVQDVSSMNLEKMFLVRLRFGACTAIILVPMILSIWSSFNSAKIIRMTTSANYVNEDAINKYSTVEQVFLAPYDLECDSLSGRFNIPADADSDLELTIYDYTSGELLSKQNYSVQDVATDQVLSFPIVEFEAGNQYSIQFASDSETWNCPVIVGTRAFKTVGEGATHASVSGDTKDYNYAIVLYENEEKETNYEKSSMN